MIGDLDGVVVVPREDVADVVVASQQRIAKEEKSRERLRAGEAGLDMYGLRNKLKELGLGVKTKTVEAVEIDENWFSSV